ncbi:hypothetical protein ACIBKY_06905 [Nonomuraea sp. NPDC050394]|uniref:hypothetical protein n=1 Tax=Nonomuraea sp. NPDC050394 TaxID=3364363 RepID=UPI0037B2E21E
MTIGTRLTLAALAAPLGALLLTSAAFAATAPERPSPDSPFTVHVGRPDCGNRTVEVRLRSTSDYQAEFQITRDDETVDTGTLEARRNYTKRIKLGHQRRVEIETFYTTQDSRDKLVSRDQVSNECGGNHRRAWDRGREWDDCDRGEPCWDDEECDRGEDCWDDDDCDRGEPCWDDDEDDCRRGDCDDDELPFTGPPADLMGKLATAGGLVLTGGIVWWYGSLWPRQNYRRPESTL